MTIFLSGATGTLNLDRWIVTTEDGSIIGRFMEETLSSSSVLRLRMSDGRTFDTPIDNPNEYEEHRQLLAKALGSDNFHLHIRPI